MFLLISYIKVVEVMEAVVAEVVAAVAVAEDIRVWE